MRVELEHIRMLAERVAQDTALLYRDEVDREGRWPAETLRALGEVGLLGLLVPEECGGLAGGMLTLVTACEALARVCPSAALCFGMHCVGSAVIAAKATRLQQDRYLRPISRGEHITTLAVSERGTGSHLYLANTELRTEGDHFVVNGEKHFVTSGGWADSYVISAAGVGPNAGPGEFSCVLLDRNLPGVQWGEPWRGLGMRGNESRSMELNQVMVSRDALLGHEGDQTWYIFEVIAPFFLMAMSGTYLGVAAEALNIATHHLSSRRYSHSGESLASTPVLQHRLAEMWIAVNRTRALVYQAARLGDEADPGALVSILASKADVADMVVAVTNEAMTLCGGMAYAENAFLSRLLRDARAAHVMAPTTDILKTWAGRALLGQPML